MAASSPTGGRVGACGRHPVAVRCPVGRRPVSSLSEKRMDGIFENTAVRCLFDLWLLELDVLKSYGARTMSNTSESSKLEEIVRHPFDLFPRH